MPKPVSHKYDKTDDGGDDNVNPRVLADHELRYWFGMCTFHRDTDTANALYAEIVRRIHERLLSEVAR